MQNWEKYNCLEKRVKDFKLVKISESQIKEALKIADLIIKKFPDVDPYYVGILINKNKTLSFIFNYNQFEFKISTTR